MADCCNNELAASVGAEKSYKRVVDAYDAKHGKYDPRPKPTANLEQAASTVSPFGPLSGGR